MRVLPAAFMFTLTVAAAQPAELVEPEPETVTIQKALLIELIQAYKKQMVLNILLNEEQEKTNDRIDRWHNGTGCI
jgi:hypothetical protein